MSMRSAPKGSFVEGHDQGVNLGDECSRGTLGHPKGDQGLYEAEDPQLLFTLLPFGVGYEDSCCRCRCIAS